MLIYLSFFFLCMCVWVYNLQPEFDSNESILNQIQNKQTDLSMCGDLNNNKKNFPFDYVCSFGSNDLCVCKKKMKMKKNEIKKKTTMDWKWTKKNWKNHKWKLKKKNKCKQNQTEIWNGIFVFFLNMLFIGKPEKSI